VIRECFGGEFGCFLTELISNLTITHNGEELFAIMSKVRGIDFSVFSILRFWRSIIN
jgi:hypothetical protein